MERFEPKVLSACNRVLHHNSTAARMYTNTLGESIQINRLHTGAFATPICRSCNGESLLDGVMHLVTTGVKKNNCRGGVLSQKTVVFSDTCNSLWRKAQFLSAKNFTIRPKPSEGRFFGQVQSFYGKNREKSTCHADRGAPHEARSGRKVRIMGRLRSFDCTSGSNPDARAAELRQTAWLNRKNELLVHAPALLGSRPGSTWPIFGASLD